MDHWPKQIKNRPWRIQKPQPFWDYGNFNSQGFPELIRYFLRKCGVSVSPASGPSVRIWKTKFKKSITCEMRPGRTIRRFFAAEACSQAYLGSEKLPTGSKNKTPKIKQQYWVLPTAVCDYLSYSWNQTQSPHTCLNLQARADWIGQH